MGGPWWTSATLLTALCLLPDVNGHLIVFIFVVPQNVPTSSLLSSGMVEEWKNKVYLSPGQSPSNGFTDVAVFVQSPESLLRASCVPCRASA